MFFALKILEIGFLSFFKIKCSTERYFLLKKKARLHEFDHPVDGTFQELFILVYRHDSSFTPRLLQLFFSQYVSKCSEDFFSLSSSPPTRR